jgi:hypothetical protein
MKRKLLSLMSVLIVVGMSFAVISAQQTENRRAAAANSLYVISAKAGGVNYVDGRVAVARENARSSYLIKGDSIEIGDKVSTGADGRAEILLNPGSYVRLDKNSEFEFVTTTLDNLEVKVNRGSAMFEVFAADEFKVTVNANDTKFYLVDTGIYRVDVLADGTSKIAVWKGKAELADSTKVKKSRETIVGNGQTETEKFDRDEKDDFEQWSKDRAKLLAKANSKLERDGMRDSLINSYSRNPWSVYDSFGLWAYSPAYGAYCFLPFGYNWYSPYGYGFGRSIWYYRLPRYINIYVPTQTNPTPGGNTNANNTARRVPPNRDNRANEGARMPRKNPVETVQPRSRRQIESQGFPTQPSFPTRRSTPILVVPQNGDRKSRPNE